MRDLERGIPAETNERPFRAEQDLRGTECFALPSALPQDQDVLKRFPGPAARPVASDAMFELETA